jgi:hypothetical protein
MKNDDDNNNNNNNNNKNNMVSGLNVVNMQSAIITGEQ